MKYLLVYILAFVFAFGIIGCSSEKTKKDAKPEFKSAQKYMCVAYVAGYRDFDFTTIDVSGITHINYAFGNILEGEAVFDTTKIDGKNLTPDDIVKLNNRLEKYYRRLMTSEQKIVSN